MAKVGLKRASELTGKSPSTIHRAVKAGRLSCDLKEDGERLFDTSELDRVYGLLAQGDIAAATPRNSESNPAQSVEFAVLQAKLFAAEDRLRELEKDRDAWRDQAKQLARLAPPPAEPKGLIARLFGRGRG